MDKILFVSEHGNSLPIALDLLSEGVECQTYVHEKDYRPIYKNILPRLSIDGLKQAVKQATHIVIDMVRPNKKTTEDMELLKAFSINVNVPSVFGPIGDKLRKQGKNVTGPSAMTDQWELDREAGIQLARKIGLKIPEYHAFTSFKDGVKFLMGEGKGRQWVIKPSGNVALDMTYASKFKDGSDVRDLLSHTYPERFGTDKVDYVLQAFVDGIEISNALWIHQGKVVSANRTFENKQFIEGNKGPNVGSASNTVWQCANTEGIVHKQMQGLLSLVGNQAGEIDANVILTQNGDAYFLEWTCFRYGLDALYNQMVQIKRGSRAGFWMNGFKAKYAPGFAASQRLTLWPSPRVKKEEDRKEIRGNLINHTLTDLKNHWWLQDIYQDVQSKLRVAGADGLVGVCTHTGGTMEEAINAVQEDCKRFEVVGNPQWRTDHLDKHIERMDKLKKWGVTV